MDRFCNSAKRFALLSVLLTAIALPGCSQNSSQPSRKARANQSAASATPADAQAEHARLVTSTVNDITLFGELPGRAAPQYLTRSSTALTRHTFAEEGADFDPNISRDGKWLAFASTRHSEQPDLYYKAIGGMAVTQLTADPASDVQPVFSPDGSRVAFASNRSGNWDIWVVQTDGQQAVQITSGPGDELHPTWAPGGDRLAYCSLPPAGQWELWIANAEHGGNKKFIGYGVFPEWAPANDVILFQRSRQRGARWFSIWTMKLVDDEPRLPMEIAASAEYSLITPSWSMDGNRIAYAAVATSSDDTSGRPTAESADIWIVQTDGTNRSRMTDGHSANFTPAWSPDGRVFFARRRADHEGIWSVTPMEASDAGSNVALFDRRPTGGAGATMSSEIPDRRNEDGNGMSAE